MELILDKPKRTPETEQELQDIFQPHYANNMVQGLNLAIAKGLANTMKGNVDVRYLQSGALRFAFDMVLPIATPFNGICKTF